MITNNIIIVLTLFLLLRTNRCQRKWLNFGMIWLFVYATLLVLSLIFVLGHEFLVFRPDYFAVLTLPALFIINSSEKNLKLSEKILKFLLFANVIFVTAEILIGNFLVQKNILFPFLLLKPILSPTEGYPTIRSFASLNIFRPVGLFGNVHVSSFVVFLSLVYAHFPDQKRSPLYKAFLVILLFCTNNQQALLCTSAFLGCYYFPRINFSKKLLLTGFILVMFYPILLIYDPFNNVGRESIVTIWQLTEQQIEIMNPNIMVFGVQLNPTSINTSIFAIKNNIVSHDLVYDSGIYTMVVRYGFLGVTAFLLFNFTLFFHVLPRNRYLFVCLIIGISMTFAHYHVMMSSVAIFLLSVLIMQLDKSAPPVSIPTKGDENHKTIDSTIFNPLGRASSAPAK